MNKVFNETQNPKQLDPSAVRRFFAISPNGHDKLIVGVSRGRIAGFSYNRQENLKPNYSAHSQWLNDLEKSGWRFVDTSGHWLDAEWINKFAVHSAKLRSRAFERFRDSSGVGFTEVKIYTAKKNA